VGSQSLHLDGDIAVATTAPRLTIVLPTYNEADNIAVIVDRIGVAMGDRPHEIIVVDDDSPDGTSTVARSVGQTYPHVRCIRRVGRRGLSGACVEGMMAANAPVVAVMDADMQHDETRLPVMLAEIDDGADLVIGTRYLHDRAPASGFGRKSRAKGSELATALANRVTGRYTTDPMSGFFMLRRDVADTVAGSVARDGFKILFDIVSRDGADLTIREVPFEFRERAAGESKLGFLVTIQFLGLLVSRYTGGFMPGEFLLFALVGTSGLAVHMAALFFLEYGVGLGFAFSQIGATYVAMTTNFFFNNQVTYGHKSLRGADFWKGLGTFYAICSIGAFANVSIALRLVQWDWPSCTSCSVTHHRFARGSSGTCRCRRRVPYPA